MQTLKIFCLLLNTIASHAVLTAPKVAAPAGSERAKYSHGKEHLPGVLIFYSGLTKTVVYTANLLEIGILAVPFYEEVSGTSIRDLLLAARTSPQTLRLTGTFATGSLLIWGAALLRKTCYRYLGDHFTFELSLRQEHKLVTSGPYAIVRHPAYTGALLYIAGSMLIVLVDSGSIWAQLGVGFPKLWSVARVTIVALASLATCLFVQRTRVEDEVLKREFEVEWVRWARRTRYRLIPFIY